MALAEKIIRLRKQLGWSQEELAGRIAVSRQSVSKWESNNSVPDIKKIILLSQVFGVTTDTLLKDEIAISVSGTSNDQGREETVSLEQVTEYLTSKTAQSYLIAKGVIFCLCSVVPLFFFLSFEHYSFFRLSTNVASALGITAILVMVSVGVSLFIRANQYNIETVSFEEAACEIKLNDREMLTEKMKAFRPFYHRQMSIGIFLFISSFLPLMLVSMFSNNSGYVLLMLIVLFAMIAVGIYFVVPVSAQNEAFTHLLEKGRECSEESQSKKRAEKFAVFYWPLITALYIGWSLWSMDWGRTWIIWPVSGVLFVSCLGLLAMKNKEE
jgi:transcriptional regulator with XRE-family HTH domain